jgi:hypothetical protein
MTKLQPTEQGLREREKQHRPRTECGAAACTTVGSDAMKAYGASGETELCSNLVSPRRTNWTLSVSRPCSRTHRSSGVSRCWWPASP